MSRVHGIAFALALWLLPLWGQAQSYDLPSVCVGTTERYGIKGFNGQSLFNWVILMPNGQQLPARYYSVMARGDSVDINWSADLTPGIYTITVAERSDFGCWGDIIRQEIVLNSPEIFIPIPTSLENSTGFCVNSENPLELNPGDGFLNYLWQDSSSNQIYYTGESGTYTVRLVSEYTYIRRELDGSETHMRTYACTYDSVNVVRWSPPALQLPNDTMIGHISQVQISAYPNDTLLQYPGLLYNWSTGDISPQITAHGSDIFNNAPNAKQLYWVTVTDEHGCQLSDTIAVYAGTIDNFIIPAAFTPNGDGYNDTWVVPAPDPKTGFSLRDYLTEVDMRIYNRHGQMVWQRKGLSKEWDGRALNGKPLPMDSYHYIIRVLFVGQYYDFTGSVTIVR